MSAGQQYRALFEFTSTGDGILSFSVNDKFTLVSKTDDHWWLVRSASGEQGLAPIAYLQSCPVRNGGPVRSGVYTTLYDYVAQESKQLSFTKGQTLFLVDKTDVSWWCMQDMERKKGLVPVNYIDKMDVQESEASLDTSITTTTTTTRTLPEQPNSSDGEGFEQVLASIDSNISRIHDDAAKQGGMYTPIQRATLQKLVVHRKTFVLANSPGDMINHTHSISAPSPQPAGSPTKQKSSTQPKRQAPPPPSSSSSSLTKGLVKSNPRRPSDGSAFELHKRENKSKISKDQRYSVQVSPGNAWEYDAQFDSLPRRPPPHHFNEGGNPPSQDQQYYSLQRPSNKVKTSSPKSPQKQHSPLRRRSGSSSSGSPKSPQKSIRNLSVQGSPPQRVLSVPATQTTPPQSTPGGKEKGASSLPQTTPPSQPSKRPSAVAPPPQLTLPTSFTSKDGHELVEIVRTRTGSSHKKAQLAVAGVLQLIKDKVPQCEPMVDAFFVALEQARRESSTATSSGQHADLDRLQEIFFEITECKDDSQQRGWAVADDEKAISDLLEEMLQILCDANPEVTKVAIMEDKYENILTLITYYQMEPRVSIRLLLLKVFGVLCGLDKAVISILLASVLPNELGRDIQQNITDLQKTLYSSTVCTMVFSTAESVPLSVYDQWDIKYVLFLLDCIENPPPEDLEEQIPDAFINMVLGFNQHFPDPHSNLVMRALKQRPNPRNLSEKLMYLINRGEDPVAITEPCCPDSMTKFLLDLFSDSGTSGLFYTTDMMVLIDIVTRQLTDLCPGMESRTHYLELLYRIVGSTNYKDHRHRQRDLIICLNRIAGEEEPEGHTDRELTKKIWMTYPEVFEEISDL